MRWIVRLFVMAFALLLAIAAGTLFLALAALLDPVLALFTAEALSTGLWALFDAALSQEDPALLIEGAATGFAQMAGAILILPPVFIALVSEVLGWRRALWHAGTTGALTAALPWLARQSSSTATPDELHITLILGLTGAVAGLVYWLMAGQAAGSPPAPIITARTRTGS